MIKEYILLGKGKTAGLVRYQNVRLVSAFCLAVALLIGCGREPNLGDPKVREKVLSEAIDENSLQTRRAPSGEELRYAPNQERPYTGWVKDVRDEAWGDVREFYQFQNGKPNGLYISWFWNNQNYQKGNFRDGQKNGLWTEWFENGQKSEEGSYKDNIRDGLYISWHGNGQKWEKGTYKNGKKDGVWTEWDRNGQVVWHGSDRERRDLLIPIEQETTQEQTTSEPVD